MTKTKRELAQFTKDIVEGYPKFARRLRILESLRCLECHGTAFTAEGIHLGEAVISSMPRMCSHNTERVDTENLPDWVRQRPSCGCCGYL